MTVPKLLYFYLGRRVFFSVLLLEVGLCVPVVLTQLFHYLPASAVRSGLLMPALMGTLPTAIYLALPMAVGIAVALEFSRMAAEGMIAVLYSLRLSVVSVCLPATIVALIAVVLGYWTSIYIAPDNVGQMHDVIYVIRNSLNHRMLEPAQFYTFDHGTRTLYFKRWKSEDVVEGMFIHQINKKKKEEEIITAKQTEFRRNEHGVLLVMSHGTLQSRPDGSDEIRTADFDQYVIQLDMQGTNGMPARGWRGVFEMPGHEFINAWPGRDGPKQLLSDWMSEAAKRFGIPILALTHALLAIGLVLTLVQRHGAQHDDDRRPHCDSDDSHRHFDRHGKHRSARPVPGLYGRSGGRVGAGGGARAHSPPAGPLSGEAGCTPGDGRAKRRERGRSRALDRPRPLAATLKRPAAAR